MSDANNQTLAAVIALAEQHYGEEIATAIKAGLSVVAAHSLKQREHCLSLLFVGASGKGKSVSVNVLMPDRPETKKFLHRADDFTPPSFVSHVNNKKRTELDKIDLLPKVKDKTMLTKELSPLFRGDLKEMQKNFAVLTAVLDGKGYVRHSGAQGERGYTGEYLFHWIGATTPFPDHVYKLMAQLGNRIYFYEIISVDVKVDDLIAYAKQDNGDDHLKECQKAVNDFVEAHFQRYPLKSVDPSSVSIPDDALSELVRYANFISVGRAEVIGDTFTGFIASEPEGAHRIILSLKMLARGSALADQRTEVTADDMPMLRHIAFSTIPLVRRKLIRALLLNGGTITSGDLSTAVKTSRPTAIDWMKELAATGIVDYCPGDQKTSTPVSMTLAPDWQWLLDGESVGATKPTGTGDPH
jgi:hypothetical protein